MTLLCAHARVEFNQLVERIDLKFCKAFVSHASQLPIPYDSDESGLLTGRGCGGMSTTKRDNLTISQTLYTVKLTREPCNDPENTTQRILEAKLLAKIVQDGK